jgi:chromosome segregation ATPase
MITRILVLLTLLSLIPLPVWAEFYKYKDANGVLRFTDNLLEVPEDQREKLQSYQEVVTPEEKPVISESARKEAALKSRNSRIEQMNAERETLAQSYNELETERKSLLESKPDPQNQKAFDDHRQRIETYNQKIKIYEEKRQMFQEKIDTFNAELKKE